MDKKIIFLDIDGTLVGANEYIPESAKEACRKARENGHLIYLCTGRSKAEIYDFIMELGFDGTIGAGGGYVETEGKMLYHKRVSDDNVKHMVDFFNEHEVDFYLESNGGIFGSKNLVNRLEHMLYGDLENDPAAKERKKNNPHPFLNIITRDADTLYRTDVNKACFLEPSAITFEAIRDEFKDKFDVIHCTVPAFGKDSGELVVPGIHKAVAIEALINHLGLSVKDTIAIGDGMNDAEMLEFCEVGIAMGNAASKLKEIADEITDSVEDNGIYNSFKKHHLI